MAEASAVARYGAEFIGTFMLVFAIGCNVLCGQSVWGGVSIACTLTVMIYALANSSGANFNPAVSVSLGLAKKMEWSEVVKYAIVQTCAGICAGFCYLAMFGESFNLQPTRGHTWWQACLAETLYTFMLCFVVLNTAASKYHAGQNQFYGIAIGFVIVAGAYSGGSVSMGCFNPAVAFGIDCASAYFGLQYCFIYTVFELWGAVLAVAAFWICRPSECCNDIEALTTTYMVRANLLSEFLGTYMLVLTVGLNVLSASGATVLSIAASLMSMIFAVGTVSGAHFNPAVTTAVVCSGRDKCSVTEGAMYVVVQILGGVCAALTYTAMMNGESFALKPASSKWHQVIIAEFMFTFVLAFVVLSVATVKTALSEYFGFAIGMCVTAGGLAIGKISGGALNPAVAIGISSVHAMGGGIFWHCLVYSAVQLFAGVAAAAVFFLTQPSEYIGFGVEEKLP